jgi:ankyrin repeat protein
MADAFVDVATEDWPRAEALLRETPALASASPFHALVLGDAPAVERAIDDGTLDPAANAGPLDAAPLIYVCFSRYAQRGSPREAAILATAGRLLARGADPNAWFEAKAFPGSHLPCLYGATGYNDSPALARILIDAGAIVDDSESVYHSTEHANLECLRLLLAHKPTIHGNTFKHMLDREDVEGTRLFLDAGADPAATNGRGETALHWAVWRDRSPEVVRLLLSRGAPIEARRVDGRTAYAMAVLFGRDALAAALRDAGADTTLSEVDRYVQACGAADAQGAALPAPPPITAADAHLLPDLADTGHAAGVKGLLAAGIGVQERGEHGATALHFAAWRGADSLVTLLLARGADTRVEDRTFHATPGGWLQHGARYCDAPRGDYAAALRAFLDAGAFIPPASEPTGRAEVDALLRARGLLAS